MQRFYSLKISGLWPIMFQFFGPLECIFWRKNHVLSYITDAFLTTSMIDPKDSRFVRHPYAKRTACIHPLLPPEYAYFMALACHPCNLLCTLCVDLRPPILQSTTHIMHQHKRSGRFQTRLSILGQTVLCLSP